MEKKVVHYSPRKVRKGGKKDGRNWRWKFVPPSWPFWESKEPDPPLNQPQPSQYESKLISIAHENLERISGEWSREDEGLTSEYCNAKTEKEGLVAKNQKEIKEHEKAVEKYDTARKNLSEFAPRWIPALVYWLIYIAIVAGEGLFNYFVFQIFGQEKLETYVMALAIVLIIPICSHLIGHYLKIKEKSPTDKFLISSCSFAVLVLLVVLAILRETFFEASDYTLPIKPVTVTMILIGINLAIFVGLTFLSYSESRADPEGYRKAKRAFQEVEEDLRKEGGDVERIFMELEEAEARFNRAHSKREHTFERYKHRAEEERDTWVTYIREYRHGNMHSRKDKPLPESFKTDPESLIMIPAVFQNGLDWSCPGDKKDGEKEETRGIPA